LPSPRKLRIYNSNEAKLKDWPGRQPKLGLAQYLLNVMRLLAVTLRAVAGVILASFGFIACFRSHFPHYRTVEVAPGVFDEQWMSSREIWIGVGVGVALLALSGYFYWSAYRGFSHARNAA